MGGYEIFISTPPKGRGSREEPSAGKSEMKTLQQDVGSTGGVLTQINVFQDMSAMDSSFCGSTSST